jgi:serine acetyltransferase
VRIGECTVVGVGAVVTKDLPVDVIAIDNPAGGIHHLDRDETGDSLPSKDPDHAPQPMRRTQGFVFEAAPKRSEAAFTVV